MKKSSTNYTWDVSPGASDPNASNTMHETQCIKRNAWNAMHGMYALNANNTMHETEKQCIKCNARNACTKCNVGNKCNKENALNGP